jgi:predicted small lipoprotein YifL
MTEKKATVRKVLTVLALLAFIHCGKKGPLILIPEILPKPVEQITLSQQGPEIKIEIQFPDKLSDGETAFEPAKLRQIFIQYANESLPAKKMAKRSNRLLKLTPEELTQKGNSYLLKIPFNPADLDQKNHFFGIRYQYERKKTGLGRIVSIKTQVPAKPVEDLTITQKGKLLELKWNKPALNVMEQPVQGIAGYNIYRKIERGIEGEPPREFLKLNKKTVLTEYYEDTETGSEGTYSYYITALQSMTTESSPSNTPTIKISDIYPPDIPQNLMAFRAADHLFLTWKKVTDMDLAYYRVYRKIEDEADDEFKLLADKVTDNFFRDKKVRRDTVFSYTITSVDDRGNESDPTKPVKEKY